MDMKVFRLNGYDWVAAKSLTEAKEYYIQETGLSEDEAIDESCVEEENIETEILWYPIIEEKFAEFMNDIHVKLNRNFELRKGSYGCEYGWAVKLTFKEILTIDSHDKPYIFASTEC